MGSPRAAHEPQPSELNTSSGSLTFMEVGKDKLTVRYNGPAQHDNDVGSIQAALRLPSCDLRAAPSNHPVPRRCLVYYFEVAVKEASGGSITLGFSDRNFKQGRHPGYEPNSYGYRGDTGRKHHSSLPVRGEEYGPAFGPGDVVGAGIHLSKHEIFFTKNGQHLGTAFRNVTGHPLFPTIGLHSQGASVEFNFGRQPFQFDARALVAAEQRQLADALDSTCVSAGEVHQMVRGYLLHYGYAKSLAAFDVAAGMVGAQAAEAEAAAQAGTVGTAAPPAPQHQQQQSGAGEAEGGGPDGGGATGLAVNGGDGGGGAAQLLSLRCQLRQLLMAGDTAAAQQLLQQQAPGLLAAAPGGTGGTGGSFELQFHLACQQRGDIPAALAYAEGTLSGLRGASAEHDAVLRDVVALIAYQQPEQSPLAELLSPARREAAADIVNAAVLRWQAAPGAPEPQAALEAVLQQLTAVQRELHELAGGHGPEFDLQEHLPQPAGLAQHAAASQQQRRRRQEQPGEQGEAGGGATQEPVPMAE
ncbi:hypothetical protein CHLNCDRAFT_144348 [Chlorella variabilis]|uniref:B30.2/SPRY domain-containing protein n=1 Tax=Chlorella variabilis TaxID=554065 RepID=E1ZB86_CHLVA|nr:hypothetical protein CHLNCDRAFT_144348 [Chlorella variabilis]EFN56813.1 hypothetical protein CHLNCDRAFT_144348 [Chlorella variabilis]|eukprot:XP_005848915.1 hypothetical protein CHLNCDRAFT_144348 [Chlorella variabilis]